METIDPTKIIINRDERQRQTISGIEELAASIAKVGLIHPIVIDEDNVLIAGERRLTAVLYLGLLEVPFRRFSSLSPQEKQIIELEENVKRKDLHWNDEVRAISSYHSLQKKLDSEWSLQKTSDALSMSVNTVLKYLLVSKYLDNKTVVELDNFSTAHNMATRLEERKAASASAIVSSSIDAALGLPAATPILSEAPKAISSRKGTIIQGDFLSWAPTYTGPVFNVIHCDFPYGVNVGDHKGQSSSKTDGAYADKPETYFALLNSLSEFMPKVADSAHLIFWFSMKFYVDTYNELTKMGWRVAKHPLIWHKSDNTGIIPDAQRGPRQTYETAFFASRGDRPIVRAVANSYSGPTTKEFHATEKPRPMLEHFLRMVVDEHSTVLDPTCGSGNAIRVAEKLGASYSLGLELNEGFAAQAQAAFAKGE